MDADLVVLDADPAQDIRNFAKARCVFRGGLPIYTAPAASPAGNQDVAEPIALRSAARARRRVESSVGAASPAAR